MTTHKSVYSLTKIVLLTAFCLALSPIAANSQICGDVNGDSSVNILDQVYLHAYLFQGGPPPPDFSVAEIDGYGKLTLRDWVYIDAHFCQGGPFPNCTTVLPPIQPTLDSSFLVAHTQWLDSGITNTSVTVELFTPIDLEAFTLAFELKIGNDTPQIDSIVSFCGTCSAIADSIAGNAAIFSSPNVCFGIENGVETIRVHFSVSPSLERRKISITYTEQFSPAQAPTPDSSLITMLIDFDLNVWEPAIICCFQNRGDLNGDGKVNILDLTDIVCFLFRGCGNTASCPEETDINGDGSLNNILDLTALVDYIFRGGSLTSCYE